MLGFERLNLRPGAHVVAVEGRALPEEEVVGSMKSIPLSVLISVSGNCTMPATLPTPVIMSSFKVQVPSGKKFTRRLQRPFQLVHLMALDLI